MRCKKGVCISGNGFNTFFITSTAFILFSYCTFPSNSIYVLCIITSPASSETITIIWFAEGPRSQEVVEGGSVQLACTARTDPRLAKSLVVDWYRHGILLAPGPGLTKAPDNSLVLMSAAVADSGGYQCKASTMLGNGCRGRASIFLTLFSTSILNNSS